MRINNRIVFLVMMFVVAESLNATAQNDTSIHRKNTLTASVNYQSRLHYFGRVDSLNSQGLFPMIGFESKPGFYVNGSFVFVNNASRTFNYSGTVLEGGYKFPESRNFSGNLFYTHFFYNDNSEIVQAALTGQTGLNLTYNNKIANVTLGGDLKFSDKTDIGATLGLDHLFIYVIPNTKSAIAVNPSAYLYAGSQNFTQSYYQKKDVAGIPVGRQLVSEDVKQFNILSYEVSVPVVLVVGKFNASLTGAYVSPQNLLTIPNRPDQSELGKNMFYLTAGVGVRL
jgi:hypothetical protein